MEREREMQEAEVKYEKKKQELEQAKEKPVKIEISEEVFTDLFSEAMSKDGAEEVDVKRFVEL